MLNRLLKLIQFLYRIALSRFGLLRSPYKLNYIVTKECHSRCLNCKIWETTPENELELQHIQKFTKANPGLSWVNFTGGEPTDRKDLLEVVKAFKENCSGLYIVHFPTNGLRPAHIFKMANEISKLEIPQLLITVSIDGPPAENDHLRGIPGDFDRAIETLKLLRKIPRLKSFVGMTLFKENHKLIHETYLEIKKHVPDFNYSEFHVNLPHQSGHYYENKGPSLILNEMLGSLQNYLEKRGNILSPIHWIEKQFHLLSKKYITTGKTPIPCQAMNASVFLNEKGDLYPCSIWDKKIGNILEEDNLTIALNSSHANQIKQRIQQNACANCWTPCEAFQSIAVHWPKKVS